jgi:GT2 family glycosyltransferase
VSTDEPVALPSGSAHPDVSIVIPNWNGGDELATCVESILTHTTGVEFELILVDNGSTDQSREAVTSFPARNPRVTAVLNDENLMFARACNQGYAVARGRYLLIANNDIVLEDDAVARMAAYADRHPEIAVVTPLFVGPDGEPQELVRRLPNAAYVLAYYHRLGRALDRFVLGRRLRDRYLYRDTIFDEVSTVEQPGASFSLIRREIIDRLGFLFDETYPLLFNDVDLARRLHGAGAVGVVVPDIRVVHLGGVSSAKMDPEAYRGFHFDALFRYFRSHHPLQYGALCCAWPLQWFVFRRRTRAARGRRPGQAGAGGLSTPPRAAEGPKGNAG